jgi:hypothetical protein
LGGSGKVGSNSGKKKKKVGPYWKLNEEMISLLKTPITAQKGKHPSNWGLRRVVLLI